MSTNFEGAVRRRIAACQEHIAECSARVEKAPEDEAAQAELAAAHAAHEAYILSMTPYVREYFAALPRHDMAAASCSSTEGRAWFAEQGQVQRKGSVFRRYMNDIEQQPGFADILPPCVQHDVCTDCQGMPQLLVGREFLVCPECGRCYPITNLSYQNLSFDQQVNDVVPIISYRRSNHFAEWLSKLQAREMTKIPDDVMTAVKMELKKQRLSEVSSVSQAKVKEILKKLKLSKYYEHVPSIHSIITKTSAPKFPASLEDKLKQLFDEIQQPFEKFKGSKRSNMLSYGFLLYKFCELLGEDEYLPFLPLLKSTSKLYSCDQVWKRICDDRQWEFLPTV